MPMYHATFIHQLAQQNKSQRTIKQYATSLSAFTRHYNKNNPPTTPTPPSDPPEQVTEIDVANFKKWATKNLKPNYTRQILTHVRAYYVYLEALGVIPDNPVKYIDVPIQARQTPNWLNKHEQNALIRAVRKYGTLRDLTLISFFLFTGLRVFEAANVRIDDLVITERAGMVIVRKGKHNRYREVPLNKDIRRLLTKYIADNNITDYLFPNPKGGKISERALEFVVEKYRKFADIKACTAHMLRHTFAHELVVNERPLDVVAKLLGHMKADGTPRIEQTLVYTTPGQEDLQNAVESLNWT